MSSYGNAANMLQRGYHPPTTSGGTGWRTTLQNDYGSMRAVPTTASVMEHNMKQASSTSAATNRGYLPITGSPEEPIHVALAEPSTKSQFWKLVRSVAVFFIVISGLGALFEERSVGKGLGLHTEIQPEQVGNSPKRFEDVKGCDEAKAELEEIVHYLRSPETFTRLGGKLPKGVLLVGPPGTGKTLLARAIAGEAGVPFFYASGSEFEEMFVGVGARRVRELFGAAKKKAPCIVFIDEIDAIGGTRNPKDQQYMKMTLNQLLVELDGFNPNEGIIVIGATNFPESLDKALVRPGRFDRHVVVPNPDVEGRRQILELHTKNIKLGNDVDLSIIARGTPGFSGAELANLANMAALKAALEGAAAVGMQHLEYAKDKILMGAERKSAAISEDSRRLTAYHEGGHALVACFTTGALPIHKATIVPRGVSLGMVSQLPEADMTSISRRQMIAKLAVAMGGRAAEELIFGDDNVTSGAESDFTQATKLAEAMVTRYGMSDKIGKFVLDRETESPEMRSLIDAEMKKLLDEAYNHAKQVLTEHKEELHRLAKALLEKETLTADEVKKVVYSVQYTKQESKTSKHVASLGNLSQGQKRGGSGEEGERGMRNKSSLGETSPAAAAAAAAPQ
jgi:ATP-dependent metalloprotease